MSGISGPFLQAYDFRYGALAADCDTDDTTLTLASSLQATAIAPTGGYDTVLSIGTETMLCTGHSGADITVVRGQAGSTAAAHYVGDTIRLSNSAYYYNQLVGRIGILEAVIGAIMGVDTDGGAGGVFRLTGYGHSPLQVVQNSPLALSVIVYNGACVVASCVNFSTEATISIPAPSANPRIDRIDFVRGLGVNSVPGGPTRTAGTEAASPVAPAAPDNSIPLATVYCRVGMTSVKDADDSTNGYITDARVFL